MTADEYQVSPAALRQTAQGIQDTISHLQDLGIQGTADAGRGFSELSLRGMQVGHAGLQQAFEQFCDRWSWGVRTLVQDGNQIAQQLGLNAGAYYDAETYGSGVFKDAVSGMMGNPHLSDKQVETESWAQVAADNPTNDLRHADYSTQSFATAARDITTTWQAETRDMIDTRLGLGQNPAGQASPSSSLAQAQDEMFGPAPQPAPGGSP